MKSLCSTKLEEGGTLRGLNSNHNRTDSVLCLSSPYWMERPSKLCLSDSDCLSICLSARLLTLCQPGRQNTKSDRQITCRLNDVP
ncbi:hypothetical protein DPEC_G00334050 [Dallia pectoralis]|uniref:Uncharacterized protein n=1 Tax=Dallia pectoralis TaxID=75939 RepID=A0ACC2F6X2_DALPE|nr:hypothetical protein DPEC_G00334050 [Dallia pectoralis]